MKGFVKEAGKINLMHLTFSLDIGGLENLVLNLLKTLDPNRYCLRVCSLTDKTALAGEFEQCGIPVHRLNKRNGIDPFLLFSLGRLVKRHQVDILHTHNSGPFFYGFLAGKLAGLAGLVHTEHSRLEQNHQLLSKTYSLFSKGIYKIISDSIAVTNHLVHVQGISKEKVVTIYNGIDTDLYSKSVCNLGLLEEIGIKPGSRVIGTVGRLEEPKDYVTLFAAFSKVCQRIPNLYWVIVGDGSLRSSLTERARAFNLLDKIVFLGSRRDVHRILPLFDLFVLSSKSEGLPLSILEAMAASVPVIATSVGGIPEMIRDRENGLLVQPADVAALETCMADLLRNAEQAKSLSEAAFKTVVDTFSLKAMTHQYDAVYRSLMQDEISRR